MGQVLLGRAGRGDLTPARIGEMAAYLRAHGLEPPRYALRVALTVDDGQHRIHLTEYLRDEHGDMYLDVAADTLAQRPHVLDVDDGDWPQWLPGLGLDRADRPPRTILLSGDQVAASGAGLGDDDR
jgi:hypothetical protein